MWRHVAKHLIRLANSVAVMLTAGVNFVPLLKLCTEMLQFLIEMYMFALYLLLSDESLLT